MKIQFDKMAHVSQRGFHIKPGEVKYAYKLSKLMGNDYLLCHEKSRQTSFATVDGSFIEANAHRI